MTSHSEHLLTLCMLGNFALFFVASIFFSKLTLKKCFRDTIKRLSGLASECQTVWIQIRTDLWSTVCKGYQQATQACTMLMDFLCSCQMFYPTSMKQNEYNCGAWTRKQSDKHDQIQRGGGTRSPDPPVKSQK